MDSMIRAVCFDVGSTLIYAEPDVAATFTEVAQARGHHVNLEDVESHMAAADTLYEEAYLRDGDFWCDHDRAVGIWKAMYRLLARRTGLAHDEQGIADQVYDTYLQADHWAVYDDVIPCLQALKRLGLKLAIVSNWDATLANLIAQLGLLPYFDFVVASALAGSRKPDPAIFLKACELLEVQPWEAVHVGDLPEADGEGARAAGLGAVIIDRKGHHTSCEFQTIRSLVQLPDLVS